MELACRSWEASHAVATGSAVEMLPSREADSGSCLYSYSSWLIVIRCSEIRVQNDLRLGHPECLDVVSSVMSSYLGGPCDVVCVVEPFLECCCISGPWSVTPSPYSVLPSIDP
jgi:hypothetical protein